MNASGDQRPARWLQALVVLTCVAVVVVAVASVVVVNRSAAPKSAAAPVPLVYQGGPVMTAASTYAVFWQPPQLQDGTSAALPEHFEPLVLSFLHDLGGQGLFENLTQYYQVTAGATQHINAALPFAGSAVDTAPYPASTGTCRHEANCMTQGQVQAQLKSIMAAHGWTAGLDHVFLIYVAPNEDVCDTACAITSTKDSWCGTHYDASMGGTHLIYGVFAVDTSGDRGCDNFQGSDRSPLPSPNHSAVIDGVLSSTAHEIAEAVTDPLAANTGWTTVKGPQAGSEVADVCETSFLPVSADGANQQWNGHQYQVQELWDNAAHRCAQSGP